MSLSQPSREVQTTSAYVTKLAEPSLQGRSMVTTSWPASCRSGVNNSQHHAPTQLPCTKANVVMCRSVGEPFDGLHIQHRVHKLRDGEQPPLAGHALEFVS